METEVLKLFVDVAQRGSFAAVARDRNVDPSAVSRAIAALESELGVRLFQRTTRAMALTEAGELYLAHVAPVVEELAAARDEINSLRSDPTGSVRLTASVAFGQTCIVPLLPAFRDAFPRLQLELLLTDTVLDLIAERVDLAIRLAPSYRADVIGVKLFATRYRVVASPAYAARAGRPADPVDLAKHTCLRFALPEFRTHWLFRRRNLVNEIAIDGWLVISNALALRSAALDGMGPALLADWLIGHDLASGALIDLFPDYDVAATDFDTGAWLLYPSRAHVPMKVRATIDFLRRNLAAGSEKAQDEDLE